MRYFETLSIKDAKRGLSVLGWFSGPIDEHFTPEFELALEAYLQKFWPAPQWREEDGQVLLEGETARARDRLERAALGYRESSRTLLPPAREPSEVFPEAQPLAPLPAATRPSGGGWLGLVAGLVVVIGVGYMIWRTT